MPANRNPANMLPEDILQEISALREGIEQGARRILELSKTLHDRMRRTDPSAADRSVYLTYSNSWSRFAGMVQQGLQRTRQADRLLRLLPEREDSQTPDRAVPEPVRVDEAHSMPVTSPLDDFIKVYGEEYMQDAADRPRQR